MCHWSWCEALGYGGGAVSVIWTLSGTHSSCQLEQSVTSAGVCPVLGVLVCLQQTGLSGTPLVLQLMITVDFSLI